MSVQHAAAPVSRGSIRWLRVLLAGFLAEVALIGVAVPLYFAPDRTTALNLAIPPASFLVLIPFGWWAARGATRAHVLNGMLAGLAGVLIYLGLGLVGSIFTHQSVLQSMTPAYLLAHALKLAGGAVGGLIAARRASASQERA